MHQLQNRIFQRSKFVQKTFEGHQIAHTIAEKRADSKCLSGLERIPGSHAPAAAGAYKKLVSII